MIHDASSVGRQFAPLLNKLAVCDVLAVDMFGTCEQGVCHYDLHAWSAVPIV
jgi:hypothetical protein